jgi:LmbE family N-acetylglucosaminyl deacetylase
MARSPTQHCDHRAISRLATAAFLLAGTATAFPEQIAGGLTPHRPARLCYVTWPRPVANSPYPAEGQPTDLRVDARPRLARKSEAFAAHATQQLSRKHLDALALLDTEDYFVAIDASIGAAIATPADDLFAGLA